METPETVSTQSPAATQIRAEGSAHVNVVRVDLSGAAVAVIVGLVLVIGACSAVIGLDISERGSQQRDWARRTADLERAWRQDVQSLDDSYARLDRQYRMTELKLDDWTVVAHRAGIALPSDYTRGPQGNLDAKSFHIPQRGK